MSDRFYDNKGIEHSTQWAAESANWNYVSEERNTREKALQLQQKQVEVAERAAREAERQAEDLRRAQTRAAEEHVSELKRQGRKAERGRDYQNQVLFLKESDVRTRLDKFLAMLLSQIGTKKYTNGVPDEEDEDDDAFDERMAEHKKAVARFYKPISVPVECQSHGTLTNDIRTVAAALPEAKALPLPPGMLELQAEGQRIQAEIKQAEKNAKKAARTTHWLKLFAIGLFMFGGVVFVGTKMDAPDQNSHDMILAAFFMLGLGAVFSLATWISHNILSPKVTIFQKQKEKLVQKKSSLDSELEPLLKQHSEAESLAKSRGPEEHNKAIKDSIEKWMSAFQNALVKSFFDQRLWIEDEFPNRLKAVLKEIQDPYPTTCRADVSSLRKDQIESTYETLTATLAEEWAVGHFSRYFEYTTSFPLALLDCSKSYAGDPEEYDRILPVREALTAKGIFLELEASQKEWCRHEAEMLAILRAGPSAVLAT